jgi:CheY-like chemotaxis protein
MRHPLRILSVEDNPKNTELIQDLLETEGIVCEVTRAILRLPCWLPLSEAELI